MKNLISILSILFLAGYSYAQPCVQEELIKIPGEWKQGLKGSVDNVSSANLVKEKEVVQSILKIFMEGYKPMGCIVKYAGVYGYNTAYGKNWISDPYSLSTFFLPYFCDYNSEKYQVAVSTPTNLRVFVNQFTPPPNTQFFAAELPDDEQGYWRISKLPEYKNGYYYLESIADYNNEIITYFWMIGYSGKLPYKHVTQKEYLLETMAEYKGKIQEINDRVLANKKRGDELTPEDIEFYDGQREYYGKPIRLIEEMLNNKSVAELESPAVIYHPGDLQPFSSLVDLGTPYSFILIKPNPEYFNKKLPKHAPQLFSINLTIQIGHPVFEDIYEKVSTTVFSNVQKFKAMLGETYEPGKE